MPSAERSLWVSIDQIDRAIPGAFRLDRNMGAKAGFAAAALL
jgi:hypothetical protein